MSEELHKEASMKVGKRPKKRSEVVFKEYLQDQVLLLPPSLEELIPKHHLVRVVNQVVDAMDIRSLIETYEGSGTSAYHPRMLTKVLLYAYAMKLYTGRKIAKALREDVNFMWLSAYSRPDFRTINNFRSGVLKDTIEDLFKNVLSFLVEHQYIRFENYFCDGSTFEADANRHKMIWKKNAERYKKMAEEKCRALFKEIEALNEAEEKAYGNNDLEERGENSALLTTETIQEHVKKLNTTIEKTEESRKRRKAASLKKKLEEQQTKIDKYQAQQKIGGGRSGYSKTDTDASAMMMKNEEIRPAYNALIGTEDQFVVNYSVHQNPNDGTCFGAHLEQLEKHIEHKPLNIIADSVFGSEENYDLLEKKEIHSLMKFPLYHKEQSRNYRNNPFLKENFGYDEPTDTYICPDNRRLRFKRLQQEKNKNGYLSNSRHYECENCEACPLSLACRKSQTTPRTISVNTNLDRHKQQARDNLGSEKGQALRRKRGQEVESCFGDLKMNLGFRRFHLRGKEKVKVEFGVLVIAHNLRKIFFKDLAKVA